MSKLILGTVQFGLDYGINNQNGKMDKTEVFDILKQAHNYKIQILDTAAAYGNSESIIGDFLNENQPSPFDIITKIKFVENVSFETALDYSLMNLKQNKVKYLMFHSYQDYIQFKDQLSTINSKLKGLKYDYLGVSVYTNQEIEAVIADTNIQLMQVPFNLLDNELHRGKILVKAKEFGKMVHIRSVFLQGLFFMDLNKIPVKLLDLKDKINQIQEMAISYNISIAEMAMKYVLSKNYIDGVLFGVDSLSQLSMNLELSNGSLSDEIIQSIDAIQVENCDLLNPSEW